MSANRRGLFWWVDRDSNPERNATKDGTNGLFIGSASATTVTDSDARQRIVTASVAERGSVPAAREHWQAALRSALSARATELAATAADGTDTIGRALVIALEAAKAAGCLGRGRRAGARARGAPARPSRGPQPRFGAAASPPGQQTGLTAANILGNITH